MSTLGEETTNKEAWMIYMIIAELVDRYNYNEWFPFLKPRDELAMIEEILMWWNSLPSSTGSTGNGRGRV